MYDKGLISICFVSLSHKRKICYQTGLVKRLPKVLYQVLQMMLLKVSQQAVG